jgi:RNA polymerase sigma-32 factor
MGSLEGGRVHNRSHASDNGFGNNFYRSELSAITKLDAAREHALALRWQQGDTAAGKAIVRACLPFVVKIAFEYRKWGIPLDDVIQQGNVGLLRAVAKFDPSRDIRLATYAAYWIRAEIREFVVRAFRVVRVGTTKAERKALRAYRVKPGATVDELASISGLSTERVAGLLPLLSGRELSLDLAPTDGLALEQRLSSAAPSPEDMTADSEIRAQERVAVSDALATLSTRERLIVEERLMREDPVTLEALGNRLGVSKERVRQLEERAKRKLRDRIVEQFPDMAA